MEEGLNRINQINTQIEEFGVLIQSLDIERKKLQQELLQMKIKEIPVVYRISFGAEPTRNGYMPFHSYFGVFSTRENASKYISSFSTRLDNHKCQVSVVPVASETLGSDWFESLDKPVYGHNYS